MAVASPVPVPVFELLVECLELAVGLTQLLIELLVVGLRPRQVVHTFTVRGKVIADL